MFSLARKPNLLILGSILVDAFAYLVATVFTGYFLNYARTDLDLWSRQVDWLWS